MGYHDRSNDPCPECDGETWQDSADIGVGTIYGPRGCCICGWSEDPAYDMRDPENREPDPEGGFTDQFGGYFPPGNSVALAYRLAREAEQHAGTERDGDEPPL